MVKSPKRRNIFLSSKIPWVCLGGLLPKSKKDKGKMGCAGLCDTIGRTVSNSTVGAGIQGIKRDNHCIDKGIVF